MYIAFRIYFISRRSICAAFGTAPPPASEGTASAPRYVATGPVGRGSRPGPTRWVRTCASRTKSKPVTKRS